MLNEHLYNQLVARFGDVKIQNENHQMVVAPRLNAYGNPENKIIDSGENYRICCPVCGDTRHRLYISYGWGLDQELGVNSTGLVHCFNERCEEIDDVAFNVKEVLRRQLTPRMSDIIFGTSVGSGTRWGRHNAPTVAPKPQQPLQYPHPDWLIPVKYLAYSHPAARYLDAKGYDRVVLSDFWGVAYCTKYPVSREENGVPKSYAWLAGRLFFPINHAVWQARRIDGINAMKYFTQGAKGEALYGAEYAKRFPFVIVQEGAPDVWRTGGPGVGLLCKDATAYQRDLIRLNWDTVGICLDPDAFQTRANERESSVVKLYNELKRAVPNVFVINLLEYINPANMVEKLDAGALPYDVLWMCIELAAKKAGLNHVRRPSAPFAP